MLLAQARTARRYKNLEVKKHLCNVLLAQTCTACAVECALHGWQQYWRVNQSIQDVVVAKEAATLEFGVAVVVVGATMCEKRKKRGTSVQSGIRNQGCITAQGTQPPAHTLMLLQPTLENPVCNAVHRTILERVAYVTGSAPENSHDTVARP